MIYVYVGIPPKLGVMDTRPCFGRVADSLETCQKPTLANMPNLVAVNPCEFWSPGPICVADPFPGRMWSH